jgi:hypothetical protein
MPLLEGILMMNDFTLLVSRSERLTHAREHLNEMFGKKYPKNFRKEHIEYHKDEGNKGIKRERSFCDNEISGSVPEIGGMLVERLQ